MLDVALLVDGFAVLIGRQIDSQVEWLAAKYAGYFWEGVTTHKCLLWTVAYIVGEGRNEGWSILLIVACVSVIRWSMLSHADRIKADLFDLQEKRDQCSQTSLRILIEAWIAAKKKLLVKHLEKENKETGGAAMKAS